jgi:uncharacterized repeat protein (TIGR02543 family)
VTFNAAGGKVDKASISVQAGNVYGVLPVPQKTNATFLGWFTAKSAGNLVSEKTLVPSKNAHTLYAHWGANARVSLSVKAVKLKAKAAFSAKSLASVKSGASLVILGTSGKYYKVSANGKTGYVLKSSVYKLRQAKVKGKVVLLKSAKLSAKKVATIKKNSIVTIVGKKGSWYLIQAGAKKGYTPTKSVKIIS